MIRGCLRGHHDNAHGLGGAGHRYPDEFPHDRSSGEAGDLRDATGRAQR